MKNKKIALIAAGLTAPVGFYFRKHIFKAARLLQQETKQMLPKKLQPAELENYDLVTSDSGKYKLAISKEKNVNGEVVGVEILLLHDYNVLFSRLLSQPEIAVVADNGTTAVFDRKNSDYITEMLLYNKQGKTIFNKFTQMLPHDLVVHEDGRVAAFLQKAGRSTRQAEITVYFPELEIKHEFSLNFLPESIALDEQGTSIKLADAAGFTRQYSFQGKWVNQKEYEQQLLNASEPDSALDYLLVQMEDKPEEYIRRDDVMQFIESLHGVEPENGKISREAAFLFRKAGEYFEAQHDKDNAIKYYQLALEKYERVGVKMKLKALQDQDNNQEQES